MHARNRHCFGGVTSVVHHILARQSSDDIIQPSRSHLVTAGRFVCSNVNLVYGWLTDMCCGLYRATLLATILHLLPLTSTKQLGAASPVWNLCLNIMPQAVGHFSARFRVTEEQ